MPRNDTYPPKPLFTEGRDWAHTPIGAGLSSMKTPISPMKRYLTRGEGVEIGSFVSKSYPTNDRRLARMSFLRRCILVFAALIVIPLVFAACGNNEERPDTSLSKVVESGVLRVATDDTYPPLEWNDNGVIRGYDIDIAAEVAERLGVKAEFVSSKWDGLLTGLQGGQFDAVISCMNITPGRQEEAAFVEYQQWEQVIVMSPEDEPITNLEGLEGKTIAVQVATTSEEMAASVTDAQVSSFESFDTTFMELQNKRCDAIVIDEPVGMYYQKREPESFVITGSAGERAPVGIALKKDAIELQEAVAAAVAAMQEDGAAQAIFDKWFSNESR